MEEKEGDKFQNKEPNTSLDNKFLE